MFSLGGAGEGSAFVWELRAWTCTSWALELQVEEGQRRQRYQRYQRCLHVSGRACWGHNAVPSTKKKQGGSVSRCSSRKRCREDGTFAPGSRRG